MKKKSVYYSLTGVSLLLLFLGVTFLLVALGMFYFPIGPANFHYTINGVAQPYNQATFQSFRLVFLAAFGIPALILIGIGIGVLIVQKKKDKQAQELKKNGKKIDCHQLALNYSSIRVNYQYKYYLTCVHVDQKGQTFLFKSRLLRYDPRSFLGDTVHVYYDRHDMRRYFVDVDGSMGEIYEL